MGARILDEQMEANESDPHINENAKYKTWDLNNGIHHHHNLHAIL